MLVSLFYNYGFKAHYTLEELVHVVEADLFKNHQLANPEKKVHQTLFLDPGGLICTKNKPLVKNFGSFTAEVQPEHIPIILSTWKKKRLLDQKFEGQDLVKVYYGPHEIAVLPEKTYLAIGAWLALNSAVGKVARLEIRDQLQDVLIMDYPKILEE